jgi:energy-coupling factor transporter ATP-binding protein EcfA2
MLSKIWAGQLKEYTVLGVSPDSPCISTRRLNLFIGVNNSGKSRLIRTLFKAPKDEILVASTYFLDSTRSISDKLLPLISLDASIPLNNPVGGNTSISGQELHDLFSDKVYPMDLRKAILQKYQKLCADLANPNMNLTSGGGSTLFYQLRQSLIGQSFSFEDLSLQPHIGKLDIGSRYYIPILRGMRPLQDSKDVDHKFDVQALHATDLYQTRTIKDYFSGLDSTTQKVWTGWGLYSRLVELLLGKPEGREQVREYERLLGQEFFSGSMISLIPEHDNDTVAVKIGQEEQFPIYNLGDGLQQIIIITSAAFLNPEPAIFFIEEPEIGLHPGLLRQLIVFLMEHTKHQYFITTHSNHLLDLFDYSDDVLVYKLSKKQSDAGIQFAIEEASRNREILFDLGVRPSSVYLANSSIWVEGITDRLYLRAFMKKYVADLEDSTEKRTLEGFLENYHYVFVEYQGGTLGHWNFNQDDVDAGEDAGLCAIRTCSTAFLIADGDISQKGNRAEILQKQIGDRLRILPVKEIENMLPENILQQTALKLYDTKRLEKDGLNKAAISSVKFNKYHTLTNGIGYHLDKALGLDGKGKNKRRFFADESGTIKDKVKFCKTAVNLMEDSTDWELTDALRDLCAAIFEHIKTCNPK